jgi:hypothetical protein
MRLGVTQLGLSHHHFCAQRALFRVCVTACNASAATAVILQPAAVFFWSRLQRISVQSFELCLCSSKHRVTYRPAFGRHVTHHATRS